MKGIYHIITPLFIACFILIQTFISYSQVTDTTMSSLFSMSIEELINQEVTIATKSSQKIEETPAIVSVITSEDIRNKGYRELEEVLQSIPGFDMYTIRAGATSGNLRGISNIYQGGRFLVLLDGTPYNDIMYGSAFFNGTTFNMDAIDRIEIISGPGSALYGRNAFSTVLNIITKEVKNGKILEIGSSIGSYNTNEYFLSGGVNKDKIKAYISAKYQVTDGTDSRFMNGKGGESLWNIGNENIYLNSNITFGDFHFSGSYLKKEDGNSSAYSYLTNSTSFFEIGTYNLEYIKKISSKIELKVKLYGRNEHRIQEIESYEPMTILQDSLFTGLPYPIFLIAPEGIYAKPIFDAYTYGSEIEFNYTFSDRHQMLFGLQGDLHGVKNARVYSNYDLETNTPLYYIDQDTNVHFFTKYNMPLYQPGWIREGGHDYNNFALFIQDMFYPANNLNITIGGRFDIDNEAGFEFSPRIGVVYEPFQKTFVKLLFGKAYRVPTPSEQYKISGYDRGKEDLKPENIYTWDLAVSHQFSNIYSQLSVFYNYLNKLIILKTDTIPGSRPQYNNAAESYSYGLAFENKIVLNKSVYASVNYSYDFGETTTDFLGVEETFIEPNNVEHKFYSDINIQFLKLFQFNSSIMYMGNITKFKNENPLIPYEYISQDEIGNFFLINSNLRIGNPVKGLEIAFYIYNLTNTEYYYQDDTHLHQPAQPGRHFLMKAIYRL